MSGWIVELDPAAAITGRSPLALNSGAFAVSNTGVDWGEAAIKAFLAEQRYGEAAVDYRVPNRQVQIPLLVGAQGGNPTVSQVEKARRELNEKVALLQRQGGVLLRQREGAQPFYADIVNASLTLPDVYGETAALEPNVNLHLECLPDFYGEELTLDTLEGEGQIDGLLRLTGATALIAGDYPARTRLIVTDGSGKLQRGLLWGLRSTFYSPEASAALWYDAYKLFVIGSATYHEGAPLGAFGAKVVWLNNSALQAWETFLQFELEAGPTHLTHIGSYRVWARVQAASEELRLRMSWGPGDTVSPVVNAPVNPSVAGAWCLVDLGEIHLGATPVGTAWWNGRLEVETGLAAHNLYVDRIWLQPLDDSAGKLLASSKSPGSAVGPKKAPATVENDELIQNGNPWSVSGAGGSVSLTAETTKSKTLSLTKLGFAIPGGATVQGIEVHIPWTWSPSPFAYANYNFETQLAGALRGSLLGGAIGTGGTLVIGGPSSLLGAAWTPAQINEAGFGFAFSVVGGAVGVFAVSGVTVTVYYAPSPPPQDAVIYQTRLVEARYDGNYRQDLGATTYVPVTEQLGDLIRLPPSGIEGRPAELLVKQSRGVLGAEADPAIDKLKAQVKYRPCYIGRI